MTVPVIFWFGLIVQIRGAFQGSAIFMAHSDECAVQGIPLPYSLTLFMPYSGGMYPDQSATRLGSSIFLTFCSH